ncbi:MAG: TetR/AcrR family transcriptional regulator [Pseudomonadota bacterium]
MRPRQFEEQRVLDAAFEQFWRKGVRGTSLSDVAREVGVQRGSLYNAYGSKEALFLRAYRQYADDYLDNVARRVSRGPLRQRLLDFYDYSISNYCTGTPHRGCPTTRALMEIPSLADTQDTTKQAFADLLQRLIELISGALTDGLGSGEFTGDPHLTAEHLVAVARGLVVMEKAFGDEAQLRRIAGFTINAVVGG